MINAHLVWFLEFNGLLSNIQNGLRQGRNTLDHLVRFETFIRKRFCHFGIKQQSYNIFLQCDILFSILFLNFIYMTTLNNNN
jgi:hypothetical protein